MFSDVSHFHSSLIFEGEALRVESCKEVYHLVLRFSPEAGLLNKSSCLAAGLGVTKFVTVISMNWSHFVALLKSDLDVQQTGLCL